MTVTAARGFLAGGVTAGIRTSGDPDLALASDRVQAAPVHRSRRALARGGVCAVFLNSGGAKACTGPAGADDARTTAAYAHENSACGS
ncbi:bifunctional ornithine acetyltransferase/N-acetylglutamate synthase [Streptomyces sp. NPDC058664]|uniref:bifunctional ornithine acetyltransferase/N-acetylglutamate synthase n=1 Tax=unclassified Streptomyces TaxID=2593676 RepID=UPI003660AABF